MRIFESGEVFCGDRELSDLGLKRLLATVIGDDTEQMCAFLCEAPDAFERKQRKDFIKSVGDSEDQRAFLRAMQFGAHTLSKLKHLYAQDYASDVLYWFRYAQSYIETVRTLATASFDDKDLHSARFCMLVHEVRREYEHEAFGALNDALQATLAELGEWRSAVAWYQVTEGAFSNTAWLPDAEDNSFSECTGESLRRLFGDAPSESPRPLSLSNADEHLRWLCAKDLSVLQSFESLATMAKRYAYIDLQSLSQDIRIVWGILALLAYLREHGVPLCDATVEEDGSFSVISGVDVSLLDRVRNIVPNDFCEKDRISLLHGANSGGKTSFMRMIGVCTAFAMWGLPVPAEQMSCPAVKSVRTVFTMTESLSSGRLTAENEALTAATQTMSADSLLLVNEVFSSTNETDAVALSKSVLDKIYEANAWCLWNTHHLLPQYLSGLPYALYTPMVDEQGTRLYVIRKQAHTSSKASDIAAKYRLRRDQLTERFRERNIM